MTHHITTDSVKAYVLYEGSNKKLLFNLENEPKVNDLIVFRCSKLYNKCERKVLEVVTVKQCSKFYNAFIKLGPALDL